MLNTPIFKFPITLVWVDDDELFIKAATYTFGEEYQLKLFYDPNDALDYLKSYQSILSKVTFLKGNIEDAHYDSLNYSPVDMDLTKILQLYKNKEKSQEIGVVIVDYHMPNTNGIEFCQKLKDTPYKKLLLTGEADNNAAVKAFNDNTIDRFVRKDDSDFIKSLQKYFDHLTQQYFCEQTQGLLAHLEADRFLPLSDPNFVNFFNNLCKQYKITEHYLIDKNGSLLLVDCKNKVYNLILHTDHSLKSFIEIYDDEPALSKLMQAVQSRELAPFFGIGIDPLSINFNEWPLHFYKSNILVGRETYYWTIIENVKA